MGNERLYTHLGDIEALYCSKVHFIRLCVSYLEVVQELLVNVLEAPLEGGVGGYVLPGVGQQEAFHLRETRGKVAPEINEHDLVVVVVVVVSTFKYISWIQIWDEAITEKIRKIY